MRAHHAIDCRAIGRALAPAALALLLISLPSSASAATVSGAANINYTAAAGETNTVTVARSGGIYVFTDAPGVTVTPTAPCSPVATNSAACPVAGTQSITLSLGNLGDVASVADSVTDDLARYTVFGGDGGDVLNGPKNVPSQLTGDDFGQNGNDVVTGGERDDSIGLGGGNDVATGGLGDDRLFDGDGADVVDGGPGNDGFGSGESADGTDMLIGGPDRDSLDLRSREAALSITFDDVANDGAGCPGPGCENDNVSSDIEALLSGDGNDTIAGNAGIQSVQGGAGNDLIDGQGGNDSLEGSEGDDTLVGGAGNDQLGGTFGSDSVQGGAGEDLIEATYFDETDVYSGGEGLDEISGEGQGFGAQPISIDLDGVADDGFADGTFVEAAKDNVLPDVESFVGGDGDDVLIGNASANEIEGGGGDDQIIGAAGADGLIGDAGNDSIDGGADVDSIDGGSGADALRSRDRDSDQVDCGSSLDTLLADAKDEPEPSCDRTSRGLAIAAKAKLAGGEVALKVSCPAAEGVDCKAKLKLAKGKKTLDSAKSKIKSGKTKTVKLEAKGLGNGGTLEASGSFKDATGEKVTTRQRVRVG